MPLMERVREIRADEAQVDDAQLNTARQALLREIAGAGRPVRRRLGLRVGLGIGGAGALVVGGFAVAALVAGSVVAPLPGNVAPASAAEVLEKAADAAIEPGALRLAPGQYLEIRRTDQYLYAWDDGVPEPDGDEPHVGGLWYAEAAWTVEGSSVLYVPADRSADWVVDEHAPVIGEKYGARADEGIAATSDERDAWGAETGIRSVPGGMQPSERDGVVKEHHLDDRESYADMPEDTKGALAWLRLRFGADENSSPNDIEDANASAVESILEGNVNALEPETRSTLFRVLAAIDGATVVSVDGDVTTILFTWTPWKNVVTKSIEIDTARGLLLGSAVITPDLEVPADLEGVPTWESRTTYEVDIVDSAPAPTE